MRICLIEYKNYIDIDRKPIGHGLKYLKEVDKLLDKDSMAACSYEYTSDKQVLHLPFSCSSNYKNKFEKIKNIFKKIVNILVSIIKSKEEVLWFTNVDWVFFGVLGIIPCHKMIVITAYTSKDKLRSKCPRKLFDKAMDKVDLVVKTNSKLDFDVTSIFVPDFYYDDKYDKYQKAFNEKKEEILIIGTIRAEKDILGAIGVLNKTKFKARICGRFYEKSVYDMSIKKAESHISIENRVPSEEEYLRLIADYKYVFLPYKSDYQMSTSGVLMETIFLNSIPIAPSFLLEFNGISGIGYEKIQDISEDFIRKDNDKILMNNKKIVSEYRYSSVKCSLQKALNDLTI